MKTPVAEGQSDGLPQQLESISALVEPLARDAAHALAAWKKDPGSSFGARLVIRCLAAHVEACLSAMRAAALRLGEQNDIHFSADDIAKLREHRSDGSPKYIRQDELVRVSFDLFIKAVGATTVIDYGNAGHQCMIETFKRRNRLAYPQHPLDIEIEHTEIQAAERGTAWFAETCSCIWNECRKVSLRKTANQ